MRQYERSKLENTRYTLSEKFQISENIRSIAILSRVSLAAVAFVVLIVFVGFFKPFIKKSIYRVVQHEILNKKIRYFGEFKRFLLAVL